MPGMDVATTRRCLAAARSFEGTEGPLKERLRAVATEHEVSVANLRRAITLRRRGSAKLLAAVEAGDVSLHRAGASLAKPRRLVTLKPGGTRGQPKASPGVKMERRPDELGQLFLWLQAGHLMLDNLPPPEDLPALAKRWTVHLDPIRIDTLRLFLKRLSEACLVGRAA